MDTASHFENLKAEIMRQYEAAILAAKTECDRKLYALNELALLFSGESPMPKPKTEPSSPLVLSRTDPSRAISKSAKCRVAFESLNGLINVATMREALTKLYGDKVAEELSGTVRTYLWHMAKNGQLVKRSTSGQMTNYDRAK